MKKQIYGYLQRSLVKVFTNSIYSNKYKPSFAKLSHTSTDLVPLKLSQKKIRKRLIALITLRKKTFNFFRTVNIEERKSFICKFRLLNFIRSIYPVFAYRPSAKIFENFRKYSNQRFYEFNKEKKIDELLLFLALLCSFYPQTLSTNFHIFQIQFYKKLILNILVGQNSFAINNVSTIKIIYVEADNSCKLFSIGNADSKKVQLVNYSQKVKRFFKKIEVSKKKIHFYDKRQTVILALVLEAAAQYLHCSNRMPNKKLVFNQSFYIRKEKCQNSHKAFSNQHRTWNLLIYQFNYIIENIENNFINFQPFYKKKVLIHRSCNSHYFFLIRPLFSITRLDTFFICESLKLPIYPDKSNLKVDFLRNRVRKQILPAIRILLNPQFDTILCKFNELV